MGTFFHREWWVFGMNELPKEVVEISTIVMSERQLDMYMDRTTLEGY